MKKENLKLYAEKYRNLEKIARKLQLNKKTHHRRKKTEDW